MSFITQSTEREVVSAAVIEVLDNDRFDGNRNFTLELRVSTLITPLFVGTAMVVIEDDDCLSGEVSVSVCVFVCVCVCMSYFVTSTCRYVLLEGGGVMRGGWRCVREGSGLLSVMTSGTTEKLL